MNDISISVESKSFKDHWDSFVQDHSLGTFFHLYDWLELVECHTGFRLMPLVIRSGGNVCGIIPVYLKDRYGVRLCMSPPPRVSTPWMGPLLSTFSERQYKNEKLNTKLMNTIHSFLVNKLRADYISIVCVAGLDDIRPFKWLDYSCEPSYTYLLDIRNKEKVFEGFDGRIRTGIRKAHDSGLVYRHSNKVHVLLVIDAVSERYRQQNLSFALDKKFFSRLKESGAMRFIDVTGVFDNEELVAGNILIHYKERVHHWIGGIHPSRNITGVNEFLHWSGIMRYSDEGVTYYEFMGANTKRLCDHKSKYNPKLIVYYTCRWHNIKGKIANWARKL